MLARNAKKRQPRSNFLVTPMEFFRWQEFGVAPNLTDILDIPSISIYQYFLSISISYPALPRCLSFMTFEYTSKVRQRDTRME
jgi:hypothetical protein